MSTLEEIQARVETLSKRYKDVSAKKASYAGLLQAKKEELAKLKKEIEAAGLDPKRLKEKRDELQAEVIAAIEDFEKKLAVVEEAFEAYENNPTRKSK